MFPQTYPQIRFFVVFLYENQTPSGWSDFLLWKTLIVAMQNTITMKFISKR